MKREREKTRTAQGSNLNKNTYLPFKCEDNKNLEQPYE